MLTYKITIYFKDGQFIRDIYGDFKTKKEARQWTEEAYRSINIDPNELLIEVINPLL